MSDDRQPKLSCPRCGDSRDIVDLGGVRWGCTWCGSVVERLDPRPRPDVLWKSQEKSHVDDSVIDKPMPVSERDVDLLDAANAEAALESDFKLGSCKHEWSGREGRCGMCGVRQSDEGTGIDRALNPIPESPLPDSQLRHCTECGETKPVGKFPTEGGWCKACNVHAETAAYIAKLEAERDALRADVADMQRKLDKRKAAYGSLLNVKDTVLAERDQLRARADYLNKAVNEAYAKIAVLKDSLSDALNYRRFYRDEHKECERLRAIIVAALDANLDHDCGLEGHDEDCSECVLAKLLFDYAKERSDA